MASEEAALRIGGAYEELGELAKAEEQFVVAARAPDPKLSQLGVQGLRRVRERLRRNADETALAVAKEYEQLHRWDQARTEYAAAAKATTGPVRQAAIDGLRRVDRRLFSERASALTDSVLLWIGKAAAVILVLLWLPTAWSSVKTSRASIKVFPFIAPNDEAAREILFWLAYARSTLRAEPAAPPGAVLLVAASSLPYIDLPNLPSDVTEIADLDFGGAKVRLKDAMQVLARPKTRISGGWVRGAAGGQAYAELEYRSRWDYRFHSRVTRTISVARHASDLELFGYHVLIHAIEAHGH